MITAILTDIEGTTSSIAFVHDVLFPYAAEHMEAFVHAHRGRVEVEDQLKEVARLGELDLRDTDALVAQLLAWIREDKKVTPLKVLQGMLWEQGYEKGHFKGHVYQDAVDYLRQWHQQGIRLYVYSSGSVQAQRLIFGHTEYGDLTPLFSGYFDTTMGGKKEASSYQRILDVIGGPAENVLFLSDVEAELMAAREAGMNVCWLVREGEIPDRAPYPVATDFASVSLK